MVILQMLNKIKQPVLVNQVVAYLVYHLTNAESNIAKNHLNFCYSE